LKDSALRGGLGEKVKLPVHRAGLPGEADTITGSALTPLRESVTVLPAPAYRQEGGASSRLARGVNYWKTDGTEEKKLS
jgi:hypothetical protein